MKLSKYKNKKSFLVIFITLFWVAYSSSSILLFINDVDDIYQSEIFRRQELILFHTDAASNLLVDSDFSTLKDNLSEAFRLNHFALAVLKIPEQEPFILSHFKKTEIIGGDEPTGGMVKNGSFFYRTIKVFGSTLTIGTQIDRGAIIKAYLKSYFYKIIFDILLITSLSAGLIYFSLRDVIQLSKIFKNKTKRDFKSLTPQSEEAQILLSASNSYQLLTDALGSQAHVFASSLGSAIVTELRRGTKTPTSFEAVLVRMDLNHYTQTYLSTDLSVMSQTLNTFFETARICIERYDGLIYEYIGDEILFFFKIKNTFNAEETYKHAFCCVRDIFTDIEYLKTKNLLPQNITAKSSLSLGTLNFVKLDQGYSFSGVPLIQSARMLNFIQEKDRSSIIIEALNKDLVLEFTEKFEEKSALLKGFESEFNLVEIKTFTAIDQNSPNYFRSNVALKTIFKNIHSLIKHSEFDDSVMKLLSKVRAIPFGNIKSEFALEFFAMLETCISKNAKIFSAVIGLCRNFYPGELPIQFKELIEHGLKHINPRVKANCVMTLSHFDPNLDIQLTFEDKTSNRLFADIIFVLGKKAVDKHLINEIEFMVTHADKTYKSSGLYTCAALLRYHMEKDIVYFDSNPEFVKLKFFLKESLNDPDKDISKHAVNFTEATGVEL